MSQTPPEAGRWSSRSDSAPLNTWSDQDGHDRSARHATTTPPAPDFRQPSSRPAGLPWNNLIWAVGTGIYFLGTVIIFFMNQDPANGMEQQLMETVRISDQIMWTAFAGSLTFLAWSAYRILPSLRNR